MNGILSESTAVEEYDFRKPEIHEIDYSFDDFKKDCRNKYFQTFESRLVDINFTNFSHNDEINFTITHRSMEFQTELYGLNKKIKNARRKSFVLIK